MASPVSAEWWINCLNDVNSLLYDFLHFIVFIYAHCVAVYMSVLNIFIESYFNIMIHNGKSCIFEVLLEFAFWSFVGYYTLISLPSYLCIDEILPINH